MKILYVAKHTNGGNNEEGAITHALQILGHEVQCVEEHNGCYAHNYKADLLLFHKWDGTRWLRKIEIPRVFYYFDLVEWPDPTLEKRCEARRNWMQYTIPQVQLGFCTDGDWVAKDTTGKLVWLPQAADGRVVGKTRLREERTQILFTGNHRGGVDRQNFVSRMIGKYGNRFVQIEKGVHGKELQDLIGTAQIVVAPPSPVTDRYWSNRVYLTLGYGGFLLHPYTEGLRRQYVPHTDLLYYNDYDHLDTLIYNYLRSKTMRDEMSRAGLAFTRDCHLYLHRCIELLAIVKERLGIS